MVAGHTKSICQFPYQQRNNYTITRVSLRQFELTLCDRRQTHWLYRIFLAPVGILADILSCEIQIYI